MTGIDLDAIRARRKRAETALLRPDTSAYVRGAATVNSAADVPALLAEVDSLGRQLEEARQEIERLRAIGGSQC